MRFEVVDDGSGTIRIVMVGRLDAAGTAAIELPFTATISGARGDVLLDMAGVTFLASLGIRVILAAARVVARHGNRIAIHGAAPQPREVLDVIAMETLIPVAADEAGARAAIAR